MKTINNVKLGLFVLVAIVGLVFLFYVVSKKNIWSSVIELKAQFKNVQGLQKGNNVRYGGMHIGTVNDIYLVNDTTIEISMLVNGDVRHHIHKNAVASIVSDGFVGDRLVNISGKGGQGPLVTDGDLILSKASLDMDQLMELVDAPDGGIKTMFTNLNQILQKIDNSQAVWEMASDKSLLTNLQQTMANAQRSTSDAALLIQDMRMAAGNINHGQGIVTAALTDTSYVNKVDALLLQTNELSVRANKLLEDLTQTIGSVDKDLNQGAGLAHAILKDTALVHQINNSMQSLQKGVNSFNEVMDALKGSFFLRKQIRRNQKGKR